MATAEAKTLENNRNVITMSLGAALETIKNMLAKLEPDSCPAIVLVGATGMGKTEGISGIVGELGYAQITRHLSQVHPLDLGGVGLDKDTKSLYFAKPPLYSEVMQYEGKRVVFLDEIDRVQPIAQNAILQILSERKQNGYKMDNTYVIAAANAWYAQYTYELDKAIASRLCIIHVESNPDQWLKWALDRKVHPSVITCIATCPDVLNQHTSEGLNDAAIKLADPRAWFNLSQALTAGIQPEVAAMFVGEFASQKFLTASRFLVEYKDEIAQVLQGKPVPATAKVNDGAMFGIYLAAAGLVKDVPIARKYITNARKQLGDEKAYIAGRLITYNIPMQELAKDETINKAHKEMVAEVIYDGKMPQSNSK